MSAFTPAISADQVALGSAVRVVIGDTAIAVVHADEGLFAVADRCSHADVSLAEGDVVDCTIECWLHGSAFDLRSGEPLTPPATRPIRVYPTRVTSDGIIEIDISETEKGST